MYEIEEDTKEELHQIIHTLESRLYKIKQIVENPTEEEYGADYFILQDYFPEILEIVKGEMDE